MRAPSILLVLTTLLSCASPSTRIADELQRYGLDQPRSQCVGQRLSSSLTIDQLQQLAGAARAYQATGKAPGQMTIADLGQVAANVRDPAVPVALVNAATGCGIGIADLLR